MRVACGVAAGLAALVAVGCASDTAKKVAATPAGSGAKSSVVTSAADAARSTTTVDDAKGRANVEVANKGFTQLPPDTIGSSYISYAAIIRNPNATTWMAEDVNVNITFFDQAGTVVKSESDTIPVILPGQSAAVGDSDEASNAARMEVQALVGRWEKASGEVGALTADGVVSRAEEYGGVQTNATLASTFTKNFKSIKAAAVYYNAQGAITGGAYTYVDFVPAGGKVGVEIHASETVPAARTEIYATLSNISLLGD